MNNTNSTADQDFEESFQRFWIGMAGVGAVFLFAVIANSIKNHICPDLRSNKEAPQDNQEASPELYVRESTSDGVHYKWVKVDYTHQSSPNPSPASTPAGPTPQSSRPNTDQTKKEEMSDIELGGSQKNPNKVSFVLSMNKNDNLAEAFQKKMDELKKLNEGKKNTQNSLSLV